jgi:ubiquinone/menaquinone biosynthesis C-methylase UbiE
VEVKYYDNIWGNPDYRWDKQSYHFFCEKYKLRLHLDIGCGSGLIKSEAYLDFSVKALERFKGNKVLASAYRLPFRSKVFASSSMLELLEHLDSPFEAIREAIRVTKYRLIVSVPEKGYHHDKSHKRDVDYGYYKLNPKIVENLDHRWCLVVFLRGRN